MSRLELDKSLRSQILRILVSYGKAAISITDSNRLFYAEEKCESFEDILISVNKKSQRKSIQIQQAQEVIDVCSSVVSRAQSNEIPQLCAELNANLCLRTFVVGNSLSAADIACLVVIYPYFAKLKDDERYGDLLNVARWFDMVQYRIQPCAELKSIAISKSVPAPKKPKKSKKGKDANNQKGKPAISSEAKEEKEPPQGKGGKKGKKDKKKKKGKKGGGSSLQDHRDSIEFISHRIKAFEAIYARQCEERAALPDEPITITLPNGSSVSGLKFKTTPLSVAEGISKSLAKAVVVAKVNDVLWDLTRPFEGDAQLVLLKFEDSDEAKHVFWHSSSHVLGQSLERMLKGKLTIGPALDPAQELQNGGFYYDVSTEITASEAHYAALEQLIKKRIICGKGQPFERIELSKSEALEMFKFNPFKQEMIGDIFGNFKGKEALNNKVTAYRCGDLIDLCTGPHIANTNRIKALKITKNGATHWKNDTKNGAFLQRLYGIAFPTNKLMKDYQERRAKAAEADHRVIGRKQNLFFFHDLSPGSCFWLPHGTRIYERLRAFIQGEYRARGFQEVITPNVYNLDLWRISGHAQAYAENMFLFECENQQFGLKPMNCPGHCLMFAAQLRSYRDLPLRFADFGALHRNELSGSLSGLTRVRRFQQDDAHIFCRRDQLGEEVDNALKFLQSVYGVFGFEFELELSTRPTEEGKYLGEIAVWDEAEAALKEALDKFCTKINGKWKLNPGDGAFYGPKIDIKVFDSLRREHQCATIQLDFQLPLRFGLSYSSNQKSEKKEEEKSKCSEDHKAKDCELEALQKKYLSVKDGDKSQFEVPVIIHRAIYGSFERFIAILTEHLLGKWPFWLSPRQILVVPVDKQFNGYAEECAKRMAAEGYWAEADLSRDRLNNKIRKAQTAQYNFILVVGPEEVQNKTVNIRSRNNEKHGEKSVEEALAWFKELADTHQ